MNFKFTDDQISNFNEAISKYVKAVKKIINRPDHHSFDGLCAYLREQEKLIVAGIAVLKARTNEILAQMMFAIANNDLALMNEISRWDKVEMERELDAEIDIHMRNNAEKNDINLQYQQLDDRIADFDIILHDEKKIKRFLTNDVAASGLINTYSITFSDGSKLTWNPRGNAMELAAARSEFEHKMNFLDNENRPSVALK